MKKLLNAGDRIRIVLVCGGKIISHLYGGDGSVDWYYRPWKIIGVSRMAYRAAISKQLKTGEIVKVVDPKKGPVYRMSSGGLSKYYRDYPLAKLRNEPWDGKWRMVFYDLPCKLNHQRRLLRNKLVELGFGCYQKSVYVTPLDIIADLREYILKERMAKWVVVFEGDRIIGEETKALADKLWGLSDINQDYLELEKRLDKLEPSEKQKDVPKLVWDRFSNILLKDPFLPTEFLPDGWVGDKVKSRLLVKR